MESHAVPPLTTTTNISEKSVSEQYYIKKENSKQVLAAMSIGLLDDTGNPLYDFEKTDENVRNKAVAKVLRQITPTNKILADEKERRKIHFLNDRSQTGKTAVRKTFMKWLEENPVNVEEDISFIKNNVANLVKQINDAYSNQEQPNATVSGNWTGHAPMMRLIHSILDIDKNRLLFARNQQVQTRVETDSRNCPDACKEDAWDAIIATFNDENFNPKMNVYPHLHHTFNGRDPIDISYDAVVAKKTGPATSDKAKAKFQKYASILSIIRERASISGTGNGSREDSQSDEATSTGGIEIGGTTNDKANFIKQFPLGVLYLWEYAERIQFIKPIVNTINETSHVDGDNIPSIAEKNKEKKRKKKESEASQRKEDAKMMKALQLSIDKTNSNLHANNLEIMKSAMRDLVKDLDEAEDELEDAKENGASERKVKRKTERVERIKTLMKTQQADMDNYKKEHK